jgi:hypothetical protein
MAKIIERSLEELHGDDPERADAMVFGRRWAVSRRGLLGATSLGGFGAAVGAAIHYGDAMPAGLIPAALAQGAPAAAGSGNPSGPQVLNFPGKEKGLVVLGERPLVAETPEHLLDDETTPTAKFFIRNNGQIPEPPASPDTWKIVVDGEVNTPLELTLGELKSRFSPKTYRMVLECGGNGRSAFPAGGSRKSVDERRRGLCGVDRHSPRRSPEGGRREGQRQVHGALRRRPAPLWRHDEGVDLARECGFQSHGRTQPRRLRHERRAPAEHPRRAGAARRAGLAGLAVSQMADSHHAARSRA